MRIKFTLNNHSGCTKCFDFFCGLCGNSFATKLKWNSHPCQNVMRPNAMDKKKRPINQIVLKDCLQGLSELPNESADIIICDPPYNIGKDFGNDSDKQIFSDYLIWCEKWIVECVRVLKPTGTMYIYGWSETLAHLSVRVPISFRWIVWHYANKVSPSLNFWQRTHESILVCYKQKPTFNRDDVREPYSNHYLESNGKVRKATKGRFSDGTKKTVYKVHPKGALPRDVLKIPALAGGAGSNERVDHPTQKPLALCRKLIEASRNKVGDTFLLVPFAGSSSECVSAQSLGVSFLGFEINPEYVSLSNERLL